MAAVPSIGRADRARVSAPEGDLTRALYEQYASQIFRYCLHQLGSREEAEDAVQSTFLNAFRGIKRGIVPELESAWLFKIAHNVCLSRRRSTWRRDRIESPTDFDLVEELTPAPGRRADELIGLQDVLEQLPENQRRAILLREWQGLSYREIAEELELSQAAVETLIFRARRSLAHGLEQPPEPKRRRLHGGDLGNVLAGLKSVLLGGGAAIKVAATVAVVSATTVVAASPVQRTRHHVTPRTPAPAVQSPSLSQPASLPPTGISVPVHARTKADPAPGRVASLPSDPSTPAASVPPETPVVATPPVAEAPVAPAPPVQASPVEQHPPLAPPVLPGLIPPPAATVTSDVVPPGQAKKQDDTGSQATVPPGQAKKQDDSGSGSSQIVSAPPGQAKKQDDSGSGSSQIVSAPPGQAKKQDDPPAATTPVATTPVVTTPVVTTPSADPGHSGTAHGNSGNSGNSGHGNH